jgi:hypothetical protein
MTNELKSLSRLHLAKLHILSKAKMEFTRFLQITFPEFPKHLNHHSKWALKLFSSYPSPQKIARMHLGSLEDIIKVHGNCTEAVRLIKSLAKKTICNCSLS